MGSWCEIWLAKYHWGCLKVVQGAILYPSGSVVQGYVVNSHPQPWITEAPGYNVGLYTTTERFWGNVVVLFTFCWINCVCCRMFCVNVSNVYTSLLLVTAGANHWWVSFCLFSLVTDCFSTVVWLASRVLGYSQNMAGYPSNPTCCQSSSTYFYTKNWISTIEQ